MLIKKILWRHLVVFTIVLFTVAGVSAPECAVKEIWAAEAIEADAGLDASASDEMRQNIPTERLKPLLVDSADLLSDSEEESLLNMLTEVSEKESMDVAVVTVYSTDGKTPESYADDYYDYNGYGQGTNHDGVLLLVSMENRDWHITTTGFGITAVNDAAIDMIKDWIVLYLSSGNYYDAFTHYAEIVESVTDMAREGTPYTGRSHSLTVGEIRELLEEALQEKEAESDSDETQLTIPSERLKPLLVDDGLSVGYDKEEMLLDMLTAVSEKEGMDVAVVMESSLPLTSQGQEEYARNYYDYNGYGQGADRDGILLFFDWGGDCYITTTGFGSVAVNDAAIELIKDKIHSNLRNQNFYRAIVKYIKMVETFADIAREGEPYTGRESVLWISWKIFCHLHPLRTTIPIIVIVSLILGSLCTIIVTVLEKRNLKRVRKQKDASAYIFGEASYLKVCDDRFIRKSITETRIDRDDSHRGHGGSTVHMGDSGGMHGGGGGHF